MATTEASEISLVDKAITDLTDIIVSDHHLQSLCRTALHRYGRSHTLQHLTSALDQFFHTLRKDASDPKQRATGWLLDGCQTVIALRVCEYLSPEKYSLGLLISALDQAPSVDNSERLIKFVGDHFNDTERFSTGVIDGFQLPDLGQEPLIRVPIDSDNLDDHPDLEAFTALQDARRIIVSGPHFSEMATQLRRTLFRPPTELLRKVLGQYILDDGQKRWIACVVDWQLLEYIQREGLTANDLENIFTVNGDLDAADVARLGDYLPTMWKTGKEMLDMLKVLVHTVNTSGSTTATQSGFTVQCPNLEIQLLPASKTSSEQAYVKLSGNFDTMLERLEQLAWLAVTLRIPIGGQLTISDIDFRIYQGSSTVSPQALRYPAIFHLSLFTKDKMFSTDGDTQGHCWASILTESVLAYGSPMLGHTRPVTAVGLEIPLDFLTALAGIKYPILVKGRIVFATHAIVLIPEFTIGSDCIQWHFQRRRDWLNKVILKRSETWDAKLETSNPSALIHARAFIGYCKRSEVLLGTAEFEHVDGADSGVAPVSKLALQPHDQPFKIQVDTRGCIKLTDGKTWRFNRGEVAQIRGPQSDSDARLLQAAKNSVLLYDQESCIGYVVSELSVVMQFATVYLRTHSQLKRQRIPLAKISGDGGGAALEAIIKAKDLPVTFAHGPSRRYLDVVESVMDVIEHRRMQTLARQLFDTKEVSKNSLRGWNYTSLQAMKYELWERELFTTNPKSYPIWWTLFQDSRTLVLFARLSKAPIRNAISDHSSWTFNCRAWDELPTGKHLLVANIMALQRLKADVCDSPNKSALRYMLNDNLAWARPHNSRLFEQDCKLGGSCRPIQTMTRLGSVKPTSADTPENQADVLSYDQHPGPMEETGAVVFADNPGSFKTRHCWRHARSPMLNPADWNYPFIGVCSLIAFLAYWNFRLIALSAVLFASAQYLR